MSVEPENIEGWRAELSVERVLIDRAFAQRLRDKCSTGDTEADGCQADRIIVELLRKLGMNETADTHEKLALWRA